VDVRRLNNSALGVLERPVLAWIARRLPRQIVPDHLTALGLAGALTTSIGYCASRWSIQCLWIACAGLILNWLGDSLDGTLARLRSIERPRYGFFLDHTCDLFAQSAVFLSLGVSPCARFGVACVGLIAFLMLFVFSLISLHVHRSLRITYFGFGPTEIRALLLAGNLLTLGFGILDLRPWLAWRVWSGPVTIYEVVIVFLSVIAVSLLATLAVRDSSVLGRQDPPRTAAASPGTTVLSV
jgi:archaetidylinositol phosphate synthase